MTQHRTSLALAVALIAALGLSIVGGCHGPSPTTPLEQAQAAFAAGQWAECVMGCTDAISRQSDDVRAYVLRGRAFRRLGQFEPAITDFTIAIKLNPMNPQHYYLRADAYKDQGDIDLADADDKAGQKLDPAYQRAYLYAPPDDSNKLSRVAAELSMTLKESEREPTNDSAEAASRPRKGAPSQRKESSDRSIGLAADELFDTDAALDRPEVKDDYGLPVAIGLYRPNGWLAPSTLDAGLTAETGSYLAIKPAPPAALRKPNSAELDYPALGSSERKPRTAQSDRSQRGSGHAGADYYPPQRALHPFGAATMRPTGVPSEPPDEEFTGDESESEEGNRGAGGRHAAGRGQYDAGQYGPASSDASGGRGYGGVLDPYGGYTRSARPIGGMMANPYGGAPMPYGPAGAQDFGRRRRGPASRDGDAGPVSPYAPLPPAPVPFIEPPGLRYD